MAATGAWARTVTNNATLPQTLCCADMQEFSSVCLSDSDEDNTTYTDPEGRVIEDPAVIDWLKNNDFTQDDINNLGNDAAATDKLYECFLLNCDIRQPASSL